MATDTKLGLVLGVGLVIAVAVIYFPKTAQADRTTAVVPSLPAATSSGAPYLRPAPPPAVQINRRG
jgi:hypothetical protein